VVGGVGLHNDVCEFGILANDVTAFDGNVRSDVDEVDSVVAIFGVVGLRGGRPGPTGIGDFIGEHGAEGIPHACIYYSQGRGEFHRERALARIGGALRPVLVRGFVEIASEKHGLAGREGGFEVGKQSFDLLTSGFARFANSFGSGFDERRIRIGNVEKLIGLVGRVHEVRVEHPSLTARGQAKGDAPFTRGVCDDGEAGQDGGAFALIEIIPAQHLGELAPIVGGAAVFFMAMGFLQTDNIGLGGANDFECLGQRLFAGVATNPNVEGHHADGFGGGNSHGR